MKHFEPEELARFAEGKVKDSEQETFVRHLAECSECFKAYTDTLQFIEEEYKKRSWIKFPDFEGIKNGVPRIWQDICIFLRRRRRVLVPVFTALIIILLVGPYFINILQNKRIERAKIQQIGNDIENIDPRGFAPSGDEFAAAVRAGIFLEDLILVVNAGGNEELKTKIKQILISQLKKLVSEKNSLFRELEAVEKSNLPGILQSIPDQFGNRWQIELFGFGRFIERSLLLTLENRLPRQVDIDKYLIISREQDLPQGVLRHLEKLKTTKSTEQSKTYCIDIKNIFLE